MRRHGRHHGFGEFGGFNEGGRGLGRGRKLAAGDLQLVILALLEQKPRHGYELIKELDERSGGFYSPSPGMIYPALTYLEEIGYATVVAEGTKKRYEITAEGRAHLEEHGDAARAILEQMRFVGEKMSRVREFFGMGGEGEREHADLHRARDELRSALHSHAHRSAEEDQRIAGILRRAAEEIAGKR